MIQLLNLPFLEAGAVPLCAEVDPELFWPGDGVNGVAAKRICMRCELREACAAYAIDNHINEGIWGGTGRADRRRIWWGKEST